MHMDELERLVANVSSNTCYDILRVSTKLCLKVVDL